MNMSTNQRVQTLEKALHGEKKRLVKLGERRSANKKGQKQMTALLREVDGDEAD